MYEIFELLCERAGITPYKFCKDTGVRSSTISSWKTKNSVVSGKIAKIIADYFHVSIEYVMTGVSAEEKSLTNIFQIELKPLPMLGEIACGKPRFANEERESYILAGTKIKADFCLKARGDSMINARILDGDIVFIRQQDMVDNGEIAAVVVNNDNEATLKRVYYYPERKTLILKPENQSYEDLIFQDEELNNVHILGKAVCFQSDVR